MSPERSAFHPRIHLISFQAHLEKTESEILELSQNGVNLKSNFKELKEMKYVLERAQTFMAEVRPTGPAASCAHPVETSEPDGLQPPQECDLFTATPFVFQQEESDSSRALMGGEERGRLGYVVSATPCEHPT
jgi:hypothetical protein